ncbi:MAG: glycoside hydrolase family 2 protein [Lachnospiraceae bacterium]
MRNIISFNEKWAFTKNADTIPESLPQRWDWVTLPHTWNNIDGLDGDNDYYRGTCYYAKEVKKSDLPNADEYFIEFLAANSSATVYVDGKEVAKHDGGYSTWRVNITKELKEVSLIVVAVDNAPNDRVYPQVADFTFYGGLYREVNIITVNKSHFELEYFGGPGLKVTPIIEGKNAKVDVEVYIKGGEVGQNLEYTIRDMAGVIVEKTTTSIFENKVTLAIQDVILWHGRKNPYLYSIEVKLVSQEEVLDMVFTKFGCRTFKIDPEQGFILNGENYPLRGVSRHQDRVNVGNALLPEHHEEDIELIYEMGANTIRLAHYQHAQYFYDLCDEKGMILWAEIPYISSHMETGFDNTISQMKELVVQNYNHPSIVVWGLSNEISMKGSSQSLLDNHVKLNEIVKEMDPTRPTVIAAVSMCPIDDPYIQIPDVVSYNHYFGWYGGDTSMNGPWFDNFHNTFPNIPIGVSEYGCEALNWHTSNPEQGDYTEEYQAYYHEELIKQLFTRPYIWATHVWNMFDFGADARNEGGENGQNHKGLITIDRKYKKDSFYAYKAWLSDEPFVHICGKRYVDRVEEVTKVTVYSNLPEVELFANGKSIGKKESKEHFFYYEVPNQGETILVAKAKECIDESFMRKVEEFNEEYRMKEKGAILNWFDIEMPEGYFSLNDKMQDLVKNPEGEKFVVDMFTLLLGERGMSNMAGDKDNSAIMQMMGSFTVLRLIGLMGMMNKTMTKEELLELNKKLNQIAK